MERTASSSPPRRRRYVASGSDRCRGPLLAPPPRSRPSSPSADRAFPLPNHPDTFRPPPLSPPAGLGLASPSRDAVYAGPGSLVAAQTQHPLQTQSADAVLLSDHPPHRPEPNRERGVRILEDRSCRHRDFVGATRTPPPDRAQRPRLGAAAARTAKPFRPPKPEQIVPTRLLRTETPFQLRQSPRVVLHCRAYYRLWLGQSSGYPHLRQHQPPPQVSQVIRDQAEPGGGPVLSCGCESDDYSPEVDIQWVKATSYRMLYLCQ